VHRWALQRGVTLRLRGLQPSVRRVVTLAGLDPLLAPTAEPPGAPAQELALF
jgi:anti-anti-sigma regulatory factor